jgi:uncharacterized protein YbjT (DUF2867 family)
MPDQQLDIVTGAFSYTGKYIARRLLDLGHEVRTLTEHPDRPSPFDQPITTAPYSFEDPDRLVESLRGARVLYNTYWIRFPHGDMTFQRAVGNSEILFEAAKRAGIQRVVHVSVTNPDEESPLPYFRGKGLVERALKESGLSYAIIRPAILFAPEDILINNIAWLLRRYPVFAIPGSGEYRMQPICAEEHARLAVDAGQKRENVVLDAIGPETFTFEELVRCIADAVGSRARIVHAPAELALTLATVASWLVKDVMLTRDELDGLMADLLVTDSQPLGTKCLSDWLREHADRVGARYASELNRHYR